MFDMMQVCRSTDVTDTESQDFLAVAMFLVQFDLTSGKGCCGTFTIRHSQSDIHNQTSHIMQTQWGFVAGVLGVLGMF